MCNGDVYQTGKSLRALFLVLLVVPASTMPNGTTSATIIANATVIPTTKNLESTTRDPRVYDCRLTAQRIATGLGSVILIETLFCCFVLYQWIKNYRRRKSKNIICNDDNNQPLYSDVDEPQDTIPSASGRNKKDTVKSNKSKHAQDVCYHVLEEPVSPLPQVAQDSLYYCSEDCVDGATKGTPVNAKNDAFYHVLEKAGSTSPQGAQEHDSLYYCSEDCVDKTTQGTPQGKFQLPIISKKTQDNKTPATKPQKPLPYNPVLSNQSKLTTKNKATNQTGKPLKRKPGLKDNVINEMKTRTAHKNTGN